MFDFDLADSYWDDCEGSVLDEEKIKIFHLDGLGSLLLEKIITKVEEKSYFRLQQTCHAMEEFIQDSRSISVNLNGEYFLEFADNWSPLITSSWSLDEEVEGLCGTRLSLLRTASWIHNIFITKPSEIQSQHFEDFYDKLKESRITCVELILTDNLFNADQCTKLIKILQPVKVKLSCCGPARLGALFQSQILQIAEVYLDSVAASCVASKLFSRVESVTLNVSVPLSERFRLLRQTLKAFYQMSWPEGVMGEFWFTSNWEGGPFPSKKELKEQLDGYDLNVQWIGDGYISAWVPLPQQFPRGSFFKIKITAIFTCGYSDITSPLLCSTTIANE